MMDERSHAQAQIMCGFEKTGTNPPFIETGLRKKLPIPPTRRK